jgi:choline kinase
VGSRLRPLTNSLPKCLVPVAGRAILAWQVEALLSAGTGPIIIVAGYRAADVQSFCRQFGDRVAVIVNEAYDRTNNMVSLQLALGGSEAVDTVICNGDVVFDAAIARGMVGHGEHDLIAVEPGRYIEESMKVTVDAAGRVTGISKGISQTDAVGVSIDLYRFSATGIGTLARTAERLIQSEGQPNLWTEVAIDAMLPEVSVRPFDIERRRWIEVDNFDDLVEGQRLFGTPA